jgi:hypothetical protein
MRFNMIRNPAICLFCDGRGRILTIWKKIKPMGLMSIVLRDNPEVINCPLGCAVNGEPLDLTSQSWEHKPQ